MNDAKSHPIIFTAAMVRAIIDGRKTQTRRVVTPHNSLVNGTGEGIRKVWTYLDWSTAWTDPGPSPAGNPGPYWKAYYRHPDYGDDPPVFRIYPRVEAGDLLWIKETWLYAPGAGEGPIYRADAWADEMVAKWKTDPNYPQVNWRPSIFMRREFSRLDMDVLDVRGQRIQEISWGDIRAEGFKCPEHDFPAGFCHGECASLRSGFANGWDSINARRGFGWTANPPSWAYTFKVKSCAAAALKS